MPRSIANLVAEQVNKWAGAGSKQKEDSEELWPTVTVSREFGSRGGGIAEEAAKRLGFTYWDQALVQAVSEETGVKKQLLDSLDEHSWGAIEEMISAFLLHTGTVKDYVRGLAEVIHTIDTHGSAVVLGRGGQFIIDPARALRIRIVSPVEKRVKDYAEAKQIAQHEAEKQVKDKEQDREQFYIKYFEQNVTDPAHYDIVINSGAFSLEQTIEIILSTYQSKFGKLPKPPKT